MENGCWGDCRSIACLLLKLYPFRTTPFPINFVKRNVFNSNTITTKAKRIPNTIVDRSNSSKTCHPFKNCVRQLYADKLSLGSVSEFSIGVLFLWRNARPAFYPLLGQNFIITAFIDFRLFFSTFQEKVYLCRKPGRK